MFEITKLIDCINNRGVKAYVLSESNQEIKIELSTDSARYLINLEFFDDYILASYSVSFIKVYKVCMYVRDLLSHGKFNFGKYTFIKENISYDDMAEALVLCINDELTVSLIEDLTVLIKNMTALKKKYEWENVYIGKAINEIAEHFSADL